MAIAKLPEAFDSFKMSGAEMRACDRFLSLAEEVAPEVAILGPRRTQSQDIKIVLRFPEGDTWEMTKALARAVNAVRRETGVHLILD